jgi:hypothetical protein
MRENHARMALNVMGCVFRQVSGQAQEPRFSVRAKLPMSLADAFLQSPMALLIKESAQIKMGRRLTPRWSGRVKDKVPSSNRGVRAAQLNR